VSSSELIQNCNIKVANRSSSGTAGTNTNYIITKILMNAGKCLLIFDSGSVSRMLPKNPKIRKLKRKLAVVIVTEVLCGNGERCVIPGEGHRFSVCDNEVLRRIFDF
jgi:hypothetical protein